MPKTKAAPAREAARFKKAKRKSQAQKRPAETKPAKTPEPKKQAVAKEAAKKPDTPKRVHKNGMEIINTHATKNAKAKVATGGKKVAMKYIGKLPSGKIFDQTKGKASFTFRLGVGEVIRGWDVGVEGMREGDKRTLIFPAAMGYGK
jgi:FKBP-type peptidyl-prolyl cis-trans isomerases 1